MRKERKGPERQLGGRVRANVPSLKKGRKKGRDQKGSLVVECMPYEFLGFIPSRTRKEKRK